MRDDVVCADGDPALDDPGRYQQVAEHARGGLGRIVRAVDRRLGRTVAVKELLRRGAATEARFLREALITARLEHPGIVPVHEAGRWPNGDPYYVMKLVEGRTLKELIGEHPAMRDRLGLLPHVIAIADAVGYAHSEGVIHRDLKPSNVIVGAFGETIVVDWGLARDRKREAEPDGDDESMLLAAHSGCSTVSGKVVGTPGYMAPEQARGDVVDERADVYAIGAVLYEVLAGMPPHSDTTPQATLELVIAGPPPPLPVIVPGVPRELATIVATAMARDPAKRYPNATALAEDLRRFHTGKLVSAHSYSTWSRVMKKVARHRGVVAVGAASATVLAVIGVGSLQRIVAERNHARAEKANADVARESAEKGQRDLLLVQAETSLRKDPTAALAWLKDGMFDDQQRGRIVDVIDEALSLGVARHVFHPGDWVFDAIFTPDGQTAIAAVRDGDIIAYDLRTSAQVVIGRMETPPFVLQLSPDGQTLVAGSLTGDIVRFPLHGHAEGDRLIIGSGRMISGLRFSPDGSRILVAYDNAPALIIPLDGSDPTRIGPTDAVKRGIATDNWSHAVVATSANEFAAIEPGNELRPLGQTTKPIGRLALSPSGDRLLVHDGENLMTMPWSGGPLRPFAHYDALIRDVEWSPDGKSVAICGDDHDILVVDLATGTTRQLRGHTDAVYSVEWSHDSLHLLSASDDSTARVWTVSDGTSLELEGHDDDVYRARFSADEHLVATSSLDGTARVWDIAQPNARVFEGDGAIEGLAMDGDHAIVRTPTTVARWDLASGQRESLLSWTDEQTSFGSPVVAPDGSMLAMPGPSWTITVQRRSGAPVTLLGHQGNLTHVEFSADERSLYTSSYDGTVRRWDLATGADTVILKVPSQVRTFTVARDGRVIAIAGQSAWDIAASGAVSLLGDGDRWCITRLEIDRVTDRPVIHRCNGSVALLDPAGHATELLTKGFAVNRLVASPDGRLLAGALDDRSIHIWNSASGQLVETLTGHSDLVEDLAFSPDGRELASASYDRTIRIWELGNTKRHRVLRGHAAAVDRIAWHGSAQLVTGSRDGTLREWAVPALELPTAAAIRARLDAATTARIDHDRALTDTPHT
ncbi:MAG TPA: protein kinase [Kofleriaceae bacterium]